MPALEAEFALVGRADKIERRGCGGRRDDVIARPEHGQERHRDVGYADWVASKHDLAGHQPVVAQQHLHGLPRRRAGERDVVGGPAGHGAVAGHVLVVPEPFQQADELGELAQGRE